VFCAGKLVDELTSHRKKMVKKNKQSKSAGLVEEPFETSTESPATFSLTDGGEVRRQEEEDEDEAAISLAGSSQTAKVEARRLSKLRFRISLIDDRRIRNALLEWLHSDQNDELESDITRLSYNLPARLFFGPTNISLTLTFFIVRDMLKERGHDVTEIKVRAVREGLAEYLYKEEGGLPSPDLDLAARMIKGHNERGEAEQRNLMESQNWDNPTPMAPEPDAENKGREYALLPEQTTPVSAQQGLPGAPSGPPDGNESSSDSDREHSSRPQRPPRSPPHQDDNIVVDPIATRSNDQPYHESNHAASLAREVQAVSGAFKSTSSKFSGDLDENISDFLRQYDVVCRNLVLSPWRKFDLMHYIFRDDAKEWFFENIADKPPHSIGGYDGATERLRCEYQSLARQERIKQLLDCLTFDEFVEGQGTHQELKRALDKLKTRIVKLTQQCAPAFRGTAHQLAHLRRAVIGQTWSELPLQVSPPYDDMNKLVAALGAAIQHDATKSSLRKNSTARTTTFPTYYQPQRQLRNPMYGKTAWNRGKLVPTHKTERGGHSSSTYNNPNQGQMEFHKARIRSWIDENTGLLKPDSKGSPRSCHKCGSRDHLSFEVERCNPTQARTHIATRFSTGDSAEEVCMDLLDDQLAPEELAELIQSSEEQPWHPPDADTEEREEEDIALAFTRAFETRFSSRLEDRLSHAPGRD